MALIHEIHTGTRVSSISLDKMTACWNELPRRRSISASYIRQAETLISRFVEFVKESNASLREMAQVQSALCRKFLKAEEERGVTAKTCNHSLIFLAHDAIVACARVANLHAALRGSNIVPRM